MLTVTPGVGRLGAGCADVWSMEPIKQRPGPLVCALYCVFAALFYLMPLIVERFPA